LLLNNDVYLKADFIEECVEMLKTESAYDSVQGRAYHWTDMTLTNDVQSDGPLLLKKRMQGYYKHSASPAESFGPNGSFMFLRSSALLDVIDKSGYAFDEAFGTGWEDMDLWFRLQLFGHRCVYLPDAVAWHVGSASANEQKRLIDKPFEYQKRIFRNRYYVIYKNYTKEMRRKLRWALVLAELCLFPYYLIKSPESLKALRIAKAEVRDNKKELKRKRELIQKNAVSGYETLKKFYVKF